MNERATYWSKQRSVHFALALLLLCAVALGGWLARVDASTVALGDNSDLVREAVLTSARQCYAVEGEYPSSIEYLEKHYGLSVNQEDYSVTYNGSSGNVLPEVMVTMR